MQEHPIQSLMQTAMENIKEMVDVNTIIGDPVETPDGSVILPVSRVGFGFAAGGGEFRTGGDEGRSPDSDPDPEESRPFGGGAGGGVSIQPMGFLIVGHGTVKLLSAEPGNQLFDRLIDLAPALLERFEQFRIKKEDTPKDTPNAQPPLA